MPVARLQVSGTGSRSTPGASSSPASRPRPPRRAALAPLPLGGRTRDPFVLVALRVLATRRRRCAARVAAVTRGPRRADDLPPPRPAADLRRRRAAACEVGRRRRGARRAELAGRHLHRPAGCRRGRPPRSPTRRRAPRAPRRAAASERRRERSTLRSGPGATLKLSLRLISPSGPFLRYRSRVRRSATKVAMHVVPLTIARSPA